MGMSMDEIEPSEEMVTAAMREFERYAARLLRYPEAERWHANDVMGMRQAISAALEVIRQSGYRICPPKAVLMPQCRAEAEMMNLISERFLRGPYTGPDHAAKR
jgi:hypothetical protein